MNGSNRSDGAARALKLLLTRAALLVGFTLTVVPLMAAAQMQGTQAPPAKTAQLIQAKKDLSQVVLNARGAHRSLLQMEQLKLQRVIDDTQSGKHVNPAAVDRLLQDAERDARWRLGAPRTATRG